MTRAIAIAITLGLSASLASLPAEAGPPFLTDDPEPVELGHWEFYAASQWSAARHAADGTLPHFEVNYGALPGLQLHAIVPAALALRGGQPAEYGLGDIELGAKFRFITETERRPQVGTFPLVLIPTGSEARGLGAGKAQVFLPVWVQKSFGPWTTYGGGGIRLAAGERDGVAGWLLQRQLAKAVILGTETFLTIPMTSGPVELQINLGLVVNFTEVHHLLVSAGPAFGSEALGQGYVAYQITL